MISLFKADKSSQIRWEKKYITYKNLFFVTNFLVSLILPICEFQLERKHSLKTSKSNCWLQRLQLHQIGNCDGNGCKTTELWHNHMQVQARIWFAWLRQSRFPGSTMNSQFNFMSFLTKISEYQNGHIG